MNDKPKLRPCPFCRGQVSFVERGYDPRWGPAYTHIYCQGCDEDFTLDFPDTDKELINLWNTETGEEIRRLNDI